METYSYPKKQVFGGISFSEPNDWSWDSMMNKRERIPVRFKAETEVSKIASKRRNTGLRRKQIVRILRKIIIKYGSENLTVKKLAEEIGFSGGALYRHFKSKREVLLFLVDDIEENLIRDLENAFPLKNPLEFLRKISSDLLSSIEQRKGVSFLVIAEIISLGDKGLNEQISVVLNSFLGHLKRIILEGIKAGEIREDVDVDMAATIFFGMLQGLVTIWSLSGFPSTLEIKNESMWKFFFEAIKKENITCTDREMPIRLPFPTEIEPSGSL